MGWPEDRGIRVPELSPRLWLVHEMLLQSYGRKEIADHLGLSMHTVSGYMKEVYRHFDVQSHAQLVARFFRGDGGDVPGHRP
jgi:DNA-binding NarL/FixJ family response regulator